MNDYISRRALYEKTAELEANALAYIEKLDKIPLEEMDEDEKALLRMWTAILGERSAFKFDVADAPTADVRENIHAHWTHERLVSTGGCSYPVVRCSACKRQYPMIETRFCPDCGAVMDERSENEEIHNC